MAEPFNSFQSIENGEPLVGMKQVWICAAENPTEPTYGSSLALRVDHTLDVWKRIDTLWCRLSLHRLLNRCRIDLTRTSSAAAIGSAAGNL